MGIHMLRNAVYIIAMCSIGGVDYSVYWGSQYVGPTNGQGSILKWTVAFNFCRHDGWRALKMSPRHASVLCGYVRVPSCGLNVKRFLCSTELKLWSLPALCSPCWAELKFWSLPAPLFPLPPPPTPPPPRGWLKLGSIWEAGTRVFL